MAVHEQCRDIGYAARLMRRLPAAGAGALIVALAAILFLPVPATRAAASSSCTGWKSIESPPPNINVLRTALGRVDTVPFRRYVEVVLAGEWGPTNPVEALAAGAVAVKQYGWYYALAGHWRGGSYGGRCFDVRDSTVDQYYEPEFKVPSARHLAAVAESWEVTVRKGGSTNSNGSQGRLFLSTYNGGAGYKTCGSGVTGWKLWQRGASDCARRGYNFERILRLYYGPELHLMRKPASRVIELLSASNQGFARADLLGWVRADLTGDGRDDVGALVKTPSGVQVWVFRASRSGFGPGEVWWDSAAQGTALPDRDLHLVTADWDGDGRADLGLLAPVALGASSAYDLGLAGSSSADQLVTFLYRIQDGSDIQQLRAWSNPTPY